MHRAREQLAWHGGIAWVPSWHDWVDRIAGSVLRYSEMALRYSEMALRWKEGVMSHPQPQSLGTEDELAASLRTIRLKAVDARS